MSSSTSIELVKEYNSERKNKEKQNDPVKNNVKNYMPFIEKSLLYMKLGQFDLETEVQFKSQFLDITLSFDFLFSNNKCPILFGFLNSYKLRVIMDQAEPTQA